MKYVQITFHTFYQMHLVSWNFECPLTKYKRNHQAFHILNNFDIPTGTEDAWGKAPANVPSATQFTVASDTRNRMIYYRTMYNSNIRCIDLKRIDFNKVMYHSRALDDIKKQPVEMITIR